MKRVGLSMGLALAAALFVAGPSLAFDPGVAVTVNAWSSDAGHGYVAVQANGSWAPPASTPLEGPHGVLLAMAEHGQSGRVLP